MPGGTSRNRNVDGENGARAGTERSTQVCCTANRQIVGGFWLALAYAVAVGGNNRCRIGCECGLDFDHRQGRLDGRCLGRGLGKSCSLPLPLATALGLFSSAFLALEGGSISLTGMPGPPVRRSFLTSRAAITSLGPRWQEPAFAVFQEAPATARVPTARAAWLTRRQARGHSNRPTGGLAPERSGGGKVVLPAATLRRRHGRRSSRPRRRTHASLLAAFHTCERMQGHEVRKGQCRDRQIAEWLNRLCENASVPGRC